MCLCYMFIKEGDKACLKHIKKDIIWCFILDKRVDVDQIPDITTTLSISCSYCWSRQSFSCEIKRSYCIFCLICQFLCDKGSTLFSIFTLFLFFKAYFNKVFWKIFILFHCNVTIAVLLKEILRNQDWRCWLLRMITRPMQCIEFYYLL